MVSGLCGLPEICRGLTTFAPFTPFAEEYRPQFPTDKLPSVLGSMVECLAEATQTPEEMGGLLSLGVLATLFQSRFRVEVTPDWQEPLCLYCAAVAPPGERKSAVISALTAALVFSLYKPSADVALVLADEISGLTAFRAPRMAALSLAGTLPFLPPVVSAVRKRLSYARGLLK